TGFLSDEALEDLLRSTAVFAWISTGEGFGLAAVEAASRGIPVVALKGTVTEELFPDGCGHVLLDSAERRSLADAIIGLLTDAGRAREIGKAGMQRCRDVFTMEQFHARLRGALVPFSARIQ